MGNSCCCHKSDTKFKKNLRGAHKFDNPSDGDTHNPVHPDDPIVASNTKVRPHFVQGSPESLYIALFDYEARTDEDLSFRKGDMLLVIDDSLSDWWLARRKSSELTGYIPSNYVVKYNSIDAEPWYFGKLKRIEAERKLLQVGNETGTFLIRDSESRQRDYALSVRDGDTVKHYRIRQKDQGEVFITARVCLQNLEDLINHYTLQADGLCTRLTYPCPRIEKPSTNDLAYTVRDQWEIDRKTLTFLKVIGRGHHGQVWEGLWNKSTPVAIKTLRPENMSIKDFLYEAQVMKRLRHPHLVNLYAVCTNEQPVLIITELMSYGSLLSFLQQLGKQIPLFKLIDFAAQIASGMAYLEKHKFIHRDLATRNILVGEECTVKIADFGLARFTMEQVYEAKEGTRFPIKWTAPEAIIHGLFSTKSDVWSFGVVVYELHTCGAAPYPGLSNPDTLRFLEKGNRLPCPRGCPNDIYEEIMLKCWNWNPEERPTFEALQFLLESLEIKPEYREVF